MELVVPGIHEQDKVLFQEVICETEDVVHSLKHVISVAKRG
jgi:hypothetical protein